MSKQFWVALAAGLILGAFLQSAHATDAPPPARVFEIRTYHCLPGRLEALHKRFREHTMKIFEKHGMTNVAYWTFEDSPARESTLIYVISHASREQARKNWDEFRNDPEWKAVAAASEADGKIVEKVDSVFVDATDYSPMK
ncbi:MAG TPA: NIPSNAP family protein [Steroidobacteraceae bacterium]